MTSVVLNNELKGVEIYFGEKPIQTIIDSIKAFGFRWNGIKKCWYAKQSEKTIAEAHKYIENNQAIEKVVKETKKVNRLSLWDRLQFVEGTADTSKYSYQFVGSNYAGLSTKDTAKEIRTHLKKQFPEVKFSVTSEYHSIDVTIKSSPYNWMKLEYRPELESRDYREYEKEHNKELLAIIEYCDKLLDSYNFDDSDSMSDYFHTHFYSHISVDYDYTQTEQNESIKNDITDYRNKLVEADKLEEERKEAEYRQREIERAEEQKQYELRMQEEKRQIENIYNSVEVVELEENNQYFVLGSQFAHINKNCTLEEYKEEINKGEFSLENVKITREVYFNNAESLKYFSNMLLNDFTFIEGTGGSYTNDNRINSMTDYYNMTKEEQSTIEWMLQGIAVYYNNELQFIIDAQGYSYARYVGLVDNVSIEKCYNTVQIMNAEQVEEYKSKAETLIDISTTVITDNNLVNTWNKDNWNIYKNLIKNELKQQEFKLSKLVIQQLPEGMEELKVAMYKLLIEVDGIQEQFKNAELEQGRKITMYYIGDMGGMIKSRVTFDSFDCKSYAQYDNAVKVTFTPEGKRTKYYNYWYSTILVYDGWLELPEEVLNIVEVTDNFVIKKSKYGSCDNKQFDEILEYFASKGIKPIINTYKPILRF